MKMLQTPSSSDECNYQNDAVFMYSNPFRINENHPPIACSRPDPNLMFAQPPPPFYPYFSHTPPPPQCRQVPTVLIVSATCQSTSSTCTSSSSTCVLTSTANKTVTCDVIGAKLVGTK